MSNNYIPKREKDLEQNYFAERGEEAEVHHTTGSDESDVAKGGSVGNVESFDSEARQVSK